MVVSVNKIYLICLKNTLFWLVGRVGRCTLSKLYLESLSVNSSGLSNWPDSGVAVSHNVALLRFMIAMKKKLQHTRTREVRQNCYCTSHKCSGDVLQGETSHSAKFNFARAKEVYYVHINSVILRKCTMIPPRACGAISLAFRKILVWFSGIIVHFLSITELICT
jgi:hypothetical protein